MAFEYLRRGNERRSGQVFPICFAPLKGARHFPKRANVSSIRDGEIVIIWPRALARLKCSAEVIRCRPARTHSFPTGITLKQSFQTCDRAHVSLLFRHVEEAREPQEKPTPARTSD